MSKSVFFLLGEYFSKKLESTTHLFNASTLSISDFVVRETVNDNINKLLVLNKCAEKEKK